VFPLLLLLAAGLPLAGQTGENILLVVNRNSPVSREIGDYYRALRAIPPGNVCLLEAPADEEVTWPVYEKQVEQPVGDCLRNRRLQERVLYIVLTLGVPLKVSGAGTAQNTEACSVDSELALLYGKLRGLKYDRAGWVPNPFFGKRDAPFRHPDFPVYLVTRLAAFDVHDVKGMIDRAIAARNRGTFVVDLRSGGDTAGNDWLRASAILLPARRVLLEDTDAVVYDREDVIGYASWGSNDPHRKRRWLGFRYLPGAITTEFVSTNGRTFQKPPDTWTYTTWQDRLHFFAGSPQGFSADAIHEGATGASGNVYEPFLAACVRPDYLLPAYFQGRNLAESYYLAMPFLSWQGIVLGDPLCSLGKAGLIR
jgi:uncharacterized protein (TIGR03790 family)